MSQTQRTFSIIKADAVAAGQAGEIFGLEKAGFRIIGMRMWVRLLWPSGYMFEIRGRGFMPLYQYQVRAGMAGRNTDLGNIVVGQ